MREEVVIVNLYKEADPDQAPFLPLAAQLAAQRAAGKSQITIDHVGNEEDLDDENLQLDGSMVIVTHYDSPKPVEKPPCAQTAHDQHQEDLDDLPAVPEAPPAPTPAKEPVKERDMLTPKKIRSVTSMFYGKTGW